MRMKSPDHYPAAPRPKVAYHKKAGTHKRNNSQQANKTHNYPFL